MLPEASPQIIYIIGIGRSGTTLLTKLLSQHQNILTTPENYFSTFFYHAFRKKKIFSVKDQDLLGSFNLWFGKLQPYIGYTYDEENKFVKEPFSGDYKNWCISNYTLFREDISIKKNIKIIIDKNPSNSLYIDQILDFNPDAKFLFIQRDYRANILSRKQSQHIRTGEVVYNSVRWNYFMKTIHQKRKALPGYFHCLSYEDLVLNEKETMKGVFDFLQLDSNDLSSKSIYSKSMDQKIRGNERGTKKYSDLSQPIYKDRLDAWRNNLDPKEIAIAESICGTIGNRLGYQKVSESSLSVKDYLRFDFKELQLKLGNLKDGIMFYAPLEFKINRFIKFVRKVENQR